MSEQDYFKAALADFTFEAASGGAIRHLADLGYTVKQITEQLSFPTPYQRVQKAVRERLLETGVLLLEEPGSGKGHSPAPVYVVDHDKYGRTSFRRARASKELAEGATERPAKKPAEGATERPAKKPTEGAEKGTSGGVLWRERVFDEKRDGNLAAYLAEKCRENGEEKAFVFCDFGLRMEKEPALFEEAMQVLDERARDYIYGLFQGQKSCYHRLDRRMREIVAKLYERKEYHSTCYFVKTGEKIIL